MQGGKRNFLGNSSVFPSELVKIRPKFPLYTPLIPFTYFYNYNFNLFPFLSNRKSTYCIDSPFPHYSSPSPCFPAQLKRVGSAVIPYFSKNFAPDPPPCPASVF